MSAQPTSSGRSLPRRTAAPLGRLLLSELRLTVPRPRTWVTLAVLGLVPLMASIGLASVGGDQAFVLGVQVISASEFAAFTLAVPVVLVAADAFAAERAQRTLDGLVLAPVGVARLVALKATGVLAAAALSAATTTLLSLVCGLAALELGPFTLGATMTRELVVALWLTGQLAGLGMLLLPLSALVRRPAAVTATGLVVVTLAPLLALLSERLNALVPAGNWGRAVTGLSQVPADWSQLGATTLRAGVYVLTGAAATVWLLARRDG